MRLPVESKFVYSNVNGATVSSSWSSVKFHQWTALTH